MTISANFYLVVLVVKSPSLSTASSQLSCTWLLPMPTCLYLHAFAPFLNILRTTVYVNPVKQVPLAPLVITCIIHTSSAFISEESGYKSAVLKRSPCGMVMRHFQVTFEHRLQLQPPCVYCLLVVYIFGNGSSTFNIYGSAFKLKSDNCAYCLNCTCNNHIICSLCTHCCLS